MFDNFPLWPQRASSMAGNVDALFIFLLILSGMMTLVIFTALIFFAARYRHRKGVLAEQIEGSMPLELTWTVIPLGVFMVIFAWGAVVYFQQRTPPRDATQEQERTRSWGQGGCAPPGFESGAVAPSDSSDCCCLCGSSLCVGFATNSAWRQLRSQGGVRVCRKRIGLSRRHVITSGDPFVSALVTGNEWVPVPSGIALQRPSER